MLPNSTNDSTFRIILQYFVTILPYFVTMAITPYDDGVVVLN